MKLLIYGLLSILVFSQQELSLEDAIKLAIKNNYNINLVKLQKEQASNNKHYAIAAVLPKIDANASINRFSISGETRIPGQNGITTITQDASEINSRNAGLTVNWTLFDGFAMFANFSKLDLLDQSAQIKLQIAIENTVKEVVSVYLDILNNSNILENAKENLKISSTRLQLVKDNFEFGNATQLDISNSELDYNRDSIASIQAEINLVNQINRFNYLVGSKNKTEFEFEDKLDFVEFLEIDELRNSLFQNNSSINLAIKEKEISDEDYDIIISEFLPNLNFVADYSYSSRDNPDGFPLFSESYGPSFGLNLQYNLLTGGKKFIDLQNQELIEKINDIKIQDIKASIELNLINLYDSYKLQKDLYQVEELSSKTAKQNFERAKLEFKYGNITSIEYRDAQLKYNQALNSLFKAKTNVKFTEAQIQLLIGEIPS